MDGWMGGWLENEFLKKTPSPKLDLSPCLGLSTLEFVNKHILCFLEFIKSPETPCKSETPPSIKFKASLWLIIPQVVSISSVDFMVVKIFC